MELHPVLWLSGATQRTMFCSDERWLLKITPLITQQLFSSQRRLMWAGLSSCIHWVTHRGREEDEEEEEHVFMITEHFSAKHLTSYCWSFNPSLQWRTGFVLVLLLKLMIELEKKLLTSVLQAPEHHVSVWGEEQMWFIEQRVLGESWIKGCKLQGMDMASFHFPSWYCWFKARWYWELINYPQFSQWGNPKSWHLFVFVMLHFGHKRCSDILH